MVPDRQGCVSETHASILTAAYHASEVVSLHVQVRITIRQEREIRTSRDRLGQERKRARSDGEEFVRLLTKSRCKSMRELHRKKQEEWNKAAHTPVLAAGTNQYRTYPPRRSPGPIDGCLDGDGDGCAVPRVAFLPCRTMTSRDGPIPGCM